MAREVFWPTLAILLVVVASASTAALGAEGPVAAKTVYRVGRSVSAPIIISRVEPIFPGDAWIRGVEARVLLEVVVDEKGSCRVAKVVLGAAFQFNEYAIGAAEQWRFEPGRLNGVPVSVTTNLEVDFRLPPEVLRGHAGDKPPEYLTVEAHWARAESMIDSGEVHAGLAEANRALVLCLSMRAQWCISTAVGQWAHLFAKRASRDDARRALTEAIRAAGHFQDKPTQLRLYEDLGQLYLNNRDLDAAIRTFTMALTGLQPRAYGSLEARLRYLLGVAYFIAEQREMALDNMRSAASLYSRLGDKTREWEVLDHLTASLYLSNRDGVGAMPYLMTALEIAANQETERKRQRLRAATLVQVGRAKILMGETVRSLQPLAEAFTLAKRVSARHIEARALLQFGWAYETLNQPTVAKRFYSSSLGLSTAICDPSAEKDALEGTRSEGQQPSGKRSRQQVPQAGPTCRCRTT